MKTKEIDKAAHDIAMFISQEVINKHEEINFIEIMMIMAYAVKTIIHVCSLAKEADEKDANSIFLGIYDKIEG